MSGDTITRWPSLQGLYQRAGNQIDARYTFVVAAIVRDCRLNGGMPQQEVYSRMRHLVQDTSQHQEIMKLLAPFVRSTGVPSTLSPNSA